MADNDEILQSIRDLKEQGKQQHDETMGRLEKLDQRIIANEQATKNLEHATRETFRAVDMRFIEIEGRLTQVEHGQYQRQLPASTSEKPTLGSRIGRFLEDVAEGATGGIYKAKK